MVVRARHEVENPCCIRHPMALTIVPLATHISSILRSPNQRTGRKRGGVIMVKSIRSGGGKLYGKQGYGHGRGKIEICHGRK